MDSLSRQQYRLLQYHFVQMFTEHLLDVSKTFDGDLLAVVILATVGQSYLRGDELGNKDISITASSISAATGIPRQTVRRKLASLQHRGWINQIDGGAWQLALNVNEAVAREDFAPLDQRGVERVLRLVRALKGLV
jgi:Fic family protein